MALIRCPECKTEVSDKAATCPKSAYPVGGGGSTQAQGGKVQTVEQTGKKYKLQIVLSSLLLAAGFFVMIFNLASPGGSVDTMSMGMLAAGIGLIWLVIVKFLTWWQHG